MPSLLRAFLLMFLVGWISVAVLRLDFPVATAGRSAMGLPDAKELRDHASVPQAGRDGHSPSAAAPVDGQDAAAFPAAAEQMVDSAEAETSWLSRACAGSADRRLNCCPCFLPQVRRVRCSP